ncbi:MAG: DUF4388 domain-containing protein [Chloroflexi bacterium]|nr:DUF4388 domain-containing protein [Chloroflexota bacterium]
MSFRGSLRDFSVFRLLEFMAQGQRSGALAIEFSPPLAGGRSGPPLKVILYFREGGFIYITQEGGPNQGLLQLLKEEGHLNSAQEREILSRTRTNSEKEIAILILEAGLASRQEILAAIEGRVWKSLPLLLGLQDGRFQFQANLQPPPNLITVSIPLERILLQARKHLEPALQAEMAKE